MLRAEADILSSLQHPSIPTFLEYFEEKSRSYLVEEWRPGTPMSRMRFFSLPKVLWIGRRLGAVLAYLHHSQLFHGDLSPGNVLLAEKGVSVIDFGLAHRSGAHPRAKGTPGYAAPEQWDEVRSNAVSDIFSLGMLLGCALTDSEPEEVNRAGSFIHLWDDDPACLPAEFVPLLTFLERMINPSATRRPDLAEVQSTLFSLEQHLVPFR